MNSNRAYRAKDRVGLRPPPKKKLLEILDYNFQLNSGSQVSTLYHRGIATGQI